MNIICYRYDELGRVEDESCNCQDCKGEEEEWKIHCIGVLPQDMCDTDMKNPYANVGIPTLWTKWWNATLVGRKKNENYLDKSQDYA